MRIAHLTWSLGIGGIQTMLTEIANIQIQEGHEVGIFEVDSIVSETILNKLDPRIKVYQMGRTRGKKEILPFIRLNWNLWRFKPDIIHSHAGKLINVVFSSVPRVATIHGPRTDAKDYKKYHEIFSISKYIQNEWKEKWNITPILIEDGINTNIIKRKHKVRPTKEFHFIHVSRIVFNHKGQDLLVHSFAKLLEKLQKDSSCQDIKCILHFVGEGPDFQNLKDLINNLKLGDNVILEGPRDRTWVFEHLCDYDLFIQPSRREGFGLTVAEACAAKIPVLVCNIEGPLEIIDGGRLGMTFQCEDMNDLTAKLYQFIKDGYDYTKVEKAYQYTCAHYDINKTTHLYLTEYEKVLSKQ